MLSSYYAWAHTHTILENEIRLSVSPSIYIAYKFHVPKMEIWWSRWFLYSLWHSSSATVKYNRDFASIVVWLLGFVEDKTCSNSYCVHFLTCFMQEMCLYMKFGLFLLFFITYLYFSGDKDLYILGITCYINTFITKLNDCFFKRTGYFVLYKNSKFLIIHS